MEPIEKNSEHTAEITGMTHEGQGVARVEGFTVFVDGALEGELIELKIIKLNKSYAVGKLLRIIKPSADRRQPFCPAYARCGGCSLQHMDYSAQLRFKTRQVIESIRRIGKLENVVVHDTIGMKEPMNYRNKAQYPISVIKGSVAAGFYSKRSHDVVECDNCGIQDKASGIIKDIIIGFIKEKGIAVYDEASGKGLVRHIMTRAGFRTGEIMAVIVINGSVLPSSAELVERLTGNVPAVRSIFLNINRDKTNIILGDRNIKLYGSDTISDRIGDYSFQISPISFFQVNPVQTEVLYRKALEYAGLTGRETVFDLYCGAGTISLFLSEKASKVYGIEVVGEAVEDARRNALVNGVRNIEFITGEAEKVVPEMYKQGIRADVVVVDPPRKGCDETLLKTLADMEPSRIVYVSCNPATLARDLKYLDENGYKAVEAQPVDMFPWTPHVETVTLIERK